MYLLSCDTWKTLCRFAKCGGRTISYATGPIHLMIWYGPMNRGVNQLPRFKFSPNACCRSHSEKYVITCLKHKRHPPLICIGFLPTLCCTHSILYHLHLLGGLLQELWPKHYWLSVLLPAQWSSTSPTVQCLTWCHSNAGMVTIITRELHQWQHITPPIYHTIKSLTNFNKLYSKTTLFHL